MSGPEVRIKLQLGEYPSQRDQSVVLPLDEFFVREAAEALDFPSQDADILIRAFICTAPDKIVRSLKGRKELAEYISKRVTRMVLDGLSNGDMLMGYPKQPQPGSAQQEGSK